MYLLWTWILTQETHLANLQVIEKKLFDDLREMHGKGFQAFIADKVSAVAGDIIHENLGIEDSNLREALCKEINVVLNVAATTNFYER